jgi:hypothetical protein
MNAQQAQTLQLHEIVVWTPDGTKGEVIVIDGSGVSKFIDTLVVGADLPQAGKRAEREILNGVFTKSFTDKDLVTENYREEQDRTRRAAKTDAPFGSDELSREKRDTAGTTA